MVFRELTRIRESGDGVLLPHNAHAVAEPCPHARFPVFLFPERAAFKRTARRFHRFTVRHVGQSGAGGAVPCFSDSEIGFYEVVVAVRRHIVEQIIRFYADGVELSGFAPDFPIHTPYAVPQAKLRVARRGAIGFDALVLVFFLPCVLHIESGLGVCMERIVHTGNRDGLFQRRLALLFYVFICIKAYTSGEGKAHIRAEPEIRLRKCLVVSGFCKLRDLFFLDVVPQSAFPKPLPFACHHLRDHVLVAARERRFPDPCKQCVVLFAGEPPPAAHQHVRHRVILALREPFPGFRQLLDHRERVVVDGRKAFLFVEVLPCLDLLDLFVYTFQ